MGKMVDLGNVDAISVTRGAIPADQGFGFGNVAGALDLHIQEPGFTPGATIEQKYGSYGFSRTFGRVDSGQLPTQTRLFGSASYSREDKWRGAGDIDRFNLMLVGLGESNRERLELLYFLRQFGRMRELRLSRHRPVLAGERCSPWETARLVAMNSA